MKPISKLFQQNEYVFRFVADRVVKSKYGKNIILSLIFQLIRSSKVQHVLCLLYIFNISFSSDMKST